MFSKLGSLKFGVSVVVGCAALASACSELDKSRTEDFSSTEQSVLGKTFGTHDAESYQNTWQANLIGADTAVSRMNSVLGTTSFWYDLAGKQFYWYDSGDQATNSVDTVDMFVTFTHGGITSTDAMWAMWDDPVIAYSRQMRLGDESVGTSIFAQSSCETLASDANTWTRWKEIFKGGLRVAVGSHDILLWGSTKFDVLKVYAQYLNVGWAVGDSWAAGWSVNDSQDEDVAVWASGNSTNSGMSNCAYRRDSITWNNHTTYPRLRDGDATQMCGWLWTDL